MKKDSQYIKEFMDKSKLNNNDGAKALNINYQSYNNKLSRGYFKLNELMELAKYVDCKIAILDKDNTPIYIFEDK